MSDQTAVVTEPAPTGRPVENRLVERVKRIVTSDQAARWTSRLVLLLLWTWAGTSFERIPTPKGVWDFMYFEWGNTFGGRSAEWSIYNNELVRNLIVSIQRAAIALAAVLVVGLVLGFLMGRFWRLQAMFTDLVIVGIALPAFIWALLAVMWFGLQGWRAPVFVCFVSATPMLTVNTFQGSLAVPRELRDMSDAYDVPFWTQVRHLVAPSMAGYVAAGFRVAILAGWGAVMLVEWFGNTMGAGFRARYWYDAGNFDGLMAWGVIILLFVITVDRLVLERLVRKAHQWRSGIASFGGASASKNLGDSKAKSAADVAE